MASLTNAAAEEWQTGTLVITDKDGNDLPGLLKVNGKHLKDKLRIRVTSFSNLERAGTLFVMDGEAKIFTKPLPLAGARPADTYKSSEPGTYTFSEPDTKEIVERIANRGTKNLIVVWRPDKVGTREFTPVKSDPPQAVKIDTRGPVLQSIQLTGTAEIGFTLVLTFAEDDLDSTLAENGPATS